VLLILQQHTLQISLRDQMTISLVVTHAVECRRSSSSLHMIFSISYIFMQNNFPIDCVIMIHSPSMFHVAMLLIQCLLFPRLNRSILKAILLNFSALYFSFYPHKMCRYTKKNIFIAKRFSCICTQRVFLYICSALGSNDDDEQ
jgi:hypothetical protein